MEYEYKIRRKSDGLYSKGGKIPIFSTEGKSWKRREHVSNHLQQLDKSVYYFDCEVVRNVVYKEEDEVIDAMDWKVTDKTARDKERKAEKVEARKKPQMKS